MKILVVGGTGFLGTHLVYALLREGHDVIIATRKSPVEFEPSPFRIIGWPLTDPNDRHVARDCEAVVNLAGESIAGPRWTRPRKELIRNSRIQTTRDLVDLLATSPKIKIFLNASGIGFYGDRKSEVLTEESPRGEGFLAEVCSDWEAETRRLQSGDIRVVCLRTGAVLSRDGGLLHTLEPLYKMALGGPVGGGGAFISWIHIHDWIRAVIFILTKNAIAGPVNLVAPEPVTNRAFSHVYRETLRAKFEPAAPKFAIKAILGEQSDLLIDSQNARPAKLADNDFHFTFSSLVDALADLYKFDLERRKSYDYFSSQLWVPGQQENVFSFFATAKNLETISPPNYQFKVLKQSTATFMKGTRLQYHLKIHGIPINWQALIEDWQPPKQFSDRQSQGPYAEWCHRHTFESLANGVLINDEIHYRLPLGMLGRLAGRSLVKRDLQNIFTHRNSKIREIFGRK